MDTQNGKTAVPDEVREAMARAISGAPFSTARSLRKADAVFSALAAAGWELAKPEKARDAAVEIVDGLRYGLSFAYAHQADYLFAEAVIRRALLSASQAKEQAP